MTEMVHRVFHYEYDKVLNKGDKIRIVWSKGDMQYDVHTEWGGWDSAYLRYVSKAGLGLPLEGDESDPMVFLQERYVKPWPQTGAVIVVKKASDYLGGDVDQPELPVLAWIDDAQDAMHGASAGWFTKSMVEEWSEVKLDANGQVHLVD